MIISHLHRYVYIGIPRTGSKSMNHWLSEYFDGDGCGGHHDYNVPKEASDYLIFTIVRNPYDRAVSGHFAMTWDDQAPKEHELAGCRDKQARLRKFRAVLEAREKREKQLPRQSDVPLDQRIGEMLRMKQGEGHAISQRQFVERAGVKLVLYFERLPQCLLSLPFVDPANMPPFPHHPERGIRPAGNFFDLFAGTDEEQFVWAVDAEDFEYFGYRRFDPGLPPRGPRCTANSVSASQLSSFADGAG